MAVKLGRPPKLEPKPEVIAQETSQETSQETPPEFLDFEPDGEVLEVAEPARKMPPFPSKSLRTDKEHLFWKWIDSLEEQDWSHLLIYLYREWPYLDRTRTNPQAAKNIDKYGAKFTRDTVVKGDGEHPAHGSGRYQFLINDANKAVNGKGGQIGTAYITINEAEYPPIFKLDELVTEHPSNRSLTDNLIATGKLLPDGRMMTNQGGTDNAALIGLLGSLINQIKTNSQAPKDSTAESMASIFSKTHETAMAMLKDQVKADDPEKVVKLLQTFKEMMPPANSGNGMLELVMKMQQDTAKIQAESQTAREGLMVKMMEMMQAKPTSEDAEDKILARIATYKELFGGDSEGGSRKTDWKTELITQGGPVLLGVIDTIRNVITMKNYQAGMKMNQQAPQQANQQPELVAPPQSNNGAPKEPNQEMPQGEPNELITLITNYGGMIIQAINRGQTGNDIAASIDSMIGRIPYEKIAAMGKEGILAAMQSVPAFWKAVEGTNINGFVDDFIAYGVGEEEDLGAI